MEILARGTKDYLWQFSWGQISKRKDTSFVNHKGARKLAEIDLEEFKIE